MPGGLEELARAALAQIEGEIQLPGLQAEVEVLRDGWEPLRVVVDTILVKGEAPRVVELRFSRHGPIFYEDTVNGRSYAVKAAVLEPGAAGYPGALRLAEVKDCREFLAALRYYKAPSENTICGDQEGNIAWRASGLAPRRTGGFDGRLPVPGTGSYRWDGYRNDNPQELNPERGWIATANHNIHPPGYDPPLFFKRTPYPRYERIAEVLAAGGNYTVKDLKALQHDAYWAQWRWRRMNRSDFPHPLVRAYDLPPIERSGGAGTVAALGATYREIIDLADLDASVARNTPGQSGQPGSPFYGNLLETFANGEYFPLAYSRQAVEANLAHRLVLRPAAL
ncbi:MAG: penicillin acylase family protein [Gemmatimonadetes bacterium]|nr:penicillin acylase family protein [Gemmatimonadota bacterium]